MTDAANKPPPPKWVDDPDFAYNAFDPDAEQWGPTVPFTNDLPEPERQVLLEQYTAKCRQLVSDGRLCQAVADRWVRSVAIGNTMLATARLVIGAK